MQSQITTTVDLIRHGEPVGGKMYRGYRDDPLSDKGWQQMRNAVADHNHWDAIVSSPLLRCAEFAVELAEKLRIPVTINDNLKEIGWGEWEGQTAKQICHGQADRLRQFWNAPLEYTPNDAEIVTDFRDRVIQAWDKAILSHKGQRVLLVGHAGVTRVLVSHVLEMPIKRMFNIYVSNAAVTRITVDHYSNEEHMRLMFHNGELGGT